AEPAWAARSRREEDVIINDFLTIHPAGFELLQILDQVADGKVSRIALPVVPVLFAKLERRHIRTWHDFTLVAASLKNGADQGFMFPRQSAEQDRDMVALLGREGILLWTLELLQ